MSETSEIRLRQGTRKIWTLFIFVIKHYLANYLERWHRKRNPKFPYRKNLPMKSSFIPAMYENFEIIKALITTVSVIHNRPHEVKKLPQKDSNTAIFGFKVPKSILHVSNGVQILLLIKLQYQIWIITWFFNDRFRGSPPYFSNIQTNEE